MAWPGTQVERIRVTAAGKVPAGQTKEDMKRILIALLAAFILSSVVTGCNTTRGAGEDIEHAGQKIQDKVDEHTNP